MEDTKFIADFTLEPSTDIEATFKIGVLVLNHDLLYNRELPNQHPISAITGLEENLGELSDRIEDNKTNIENLVGRVTTNEQNIVTLDENKAERSELQAEITNRENADKDLSDKIDTVEDDLTEDIDALTTIVENNYTTLNNRITEVASELEQSIEENVVALQQEDTALQNQINAHSQTLTAHDTRITSNATAISQETIARQNADDNLQEQIDGITAGSDVKDIVGTYAELQAYDKTKLGDNDIIKVLQDETKENASTYYRYVASTQSFTYIGKEGPFYTKSEADNLLNAKQDTLVSGTNIKTLNNESLLGEGNIDINSAQWGSITGDINAQTDLKNILDGKQNQLTSANAGNNIIIGSALPEGYTQLEYIESTGEQMIDTGVIGSSTLGINIDYEYTTENSQAGIVGIYNNTLYISTPSGLVDYYIELRSRGNGTRFLRYPILHKKFNAKINWLGNGKIRLNNEGSGDVGTGQTDARKIMLFAVDYDGTYRRTNAKIYGCQISDGSQIIRNFVPALRESDNKSGMYDTVTNSFFTNAYGFSNFVEGGIMIQISAVVPTKTSELTNDSGYITSSYHDITKQDNLDIILLSGAIINE